MQMNILFFMRQKHSDYSLIQTNMREVWGFNANIMATFSLFHEQNLFSGNTELFIAALFSSKLMQSTYVV